MTKGLTTDQHAELAGRIRAAEARTGGEIFCVVARSSDSYFFPAACALALGVCVASLPVAFWLDRSWLSVSHLGVALAQLAAFASGLAVIAVAPGLRILLVPRSIRYRRAHANAVRQFLARNVHRTAGRTGLLIFVSLTERYAEIVADAAIDDKVAQAEWNKLVAGITGAAAAGRLHEGLCQAIDRAGDLLAAHFPRGEGDRNELPDHVVEI